mgnify:CR=1 FL=1
MKGLEVLLRDNPYERYFVHGPFSAMPSTADGNSNALAPSQAPSALMLLWPYQMLPWPAARIAWAVSNLIFSAGILWLAFRRFLPGRSIWLYAALASLFVISSQWRNIMNNAQRLLAGLFFFLLAMELADRKRSLAGVAP